MTDPIARPGNDDAGIEHATDEVVATWQQGSQGKDPAATGEEFARMREGFGEVAAGGERDAGGEEDAGGERAARDDDAADSFATTSTREGQLRHADDAGEASTAENRADTGAGPDG